MTPTSQQIRNALHLSTAPKAPQLRTLSAPRLLLVWMPILEDVCAGHGVTVGDVLSSWRTPKCVWARNEFWWTLYHRGISYARIGVAMGGYDHTAVRHGVLRWQTHLDDVARAYSSPVRVAA